MSKIQTELQAATGTDPKRGEDRQDYLARMMVAVGKLSDDAWEDLGKPSQEWFNAAAAVQNANKIAAKKDAKAEQADLPDFSDVQKAEDKPEPRRRGAAEKKEESAMKVGSEVTITNKRGKVYKGKVVELDKEIVVLETDDGEEEINLERIETTTVHNGTRTDDEGEADAAEDNPIKVGAKVTVVTKRGKEITGEIVELTDELVVVDVDGKEEELSRSRIETIKLAGGKAAKAPRGKAADADEDDADAAPARASKADKAAKEDAPEKAKRSSNEGVSIGQRIKELIADDLDATEAEIIKTLVKEGINAKENTIHIYYVDSHKFITILRAKKRIK